MEQTEYQVMRVKPGDLETALNEMTRQGWQVQSIIGAEFAGYQWFWRQTLDVTGYHLILRRAR